METKRRVGLKNILLKCFLWKYDFSLRPEVHAVQVQLPKLCLCHVSWGAPFSQIGFLSMRRILPPRTYFCPSLNHFLPLWPSWYIFPHLEILSSEGTDLIGSSVQPGNLQGTFQVTEARLTQVLGDSVAQGRPTGRQGQPGVLQGRCRDRSLCLVTLPRPGVNSVLNTVNVFRERTTTNQIKSNY